MSLEGENCIGVTCDVSSGHGCAATRTPLGLQKCCWWGTNWDENHTKSCRTLRVALSHCSHPIHRPEWDMFHRKPVDNNQTNSRHQEPGRLAQMRAVLRDKETILSHFLEMLSLPCLGLISRLVTTTCVPEVLSFFPPLISESRTQAGGQTSADSASQAGRRGRCWDPHPGCRGCR